MAVHRPSVMTCEICSAPCSDIAAREVAWRVVVTSKSPLDGQSANTFTPRASPLAKGVSIPLVATTICPMGKKS